ncbi:MAG: hypothetical protein OJJ54_12415 [Pseudonocardia sp.]|nr:hypothetical protein [Pseudonocardia sp.]
MWEPVGPLPARIYWRRRGYALVTVILFFVVSGWSLAGIVAANRDPGPSDEATTRAASIEALTSALPGPGADVPGPDGGTLPSAPDAGTSSGEATTGPTSTVPTSTGPTSTGPTSPVPTSTGPTDTSPTGTGQTSAGAPSPAGGGAEGAADPASPTTTDETVRPDDTPRPPVAVPPSSAPLSTGPPPCTNDMISVTAEIDRPEHRSGDHPVFRLVVTNVSGQACVRDLDGALQEIVVWSGDQQRRIWSSNDCVNPSTQDLRTLVPGQPVAFAVTWSGMTSTPGCTAARTRVPAGDYRLMTRVADRISPATPFRLT